MTASLSDAVAALDDRRHAITPLRSARVGPDSQEARMMVLGFDVSVRELMQLGHIVGGYTARQTDDVHEAAQAAWMDGVLSGLMLAELRREVTA